MASAKLRRGLARSLAVACCVGLAALLGAAAANGAEPETGDVLRVCADPDNMPFSNAQGEGFENKLAELIAEKLNRRLEYSWFAEATGYVPNTMGREACDLVMGYAQGTGLIEDTNPYYYTSYVLIYRDNDASLAGVDRLSDPRLKGKSIGFFARTPPASILAVNGLAGSAKPFEVNADESATKATMTMIDRNRFRPARRRTAVGTGRRLLRRTRRGTAQAGAAGEGERRAEHDLRHHHGRCGRTSRSGSTRSTS